jgi:hypothetical protein
MNDSILIEIPADAPDGVMTCYGDNRKYYGVKFPDGRVIFADARLEESLIFTPLEIAKLKELCRTIYPDLVIPSEWAAKIMATR